MNDNMMHHTAQSHPHGMLLAATSLAKREVIRFFRQRSRVLGALATPFVFWILIGSGLGTSFRTQGGMQDEHFLEYFYTGIVILTVVFTAIYTTISIIEDRQAGFLQAVLVAPVPRLAIVLGKVFGGTVLGVVQGTLFLFLAPFCGIKLGVASIVMAVLMLTMVAFSQTGLGFMIAWKMDSTQGFHAVMNLLLMPMWILSGSFFPASGAHPWIRIVMRWNPLTYGVAALRHSFYLHDRGVRATLPALGWCIVLTFFLSVVTLGVASVMVNRNQS